jgi:O-antigen/teichoic acid export membrane protein
MKDLKQKTLRGGLFKVVAQGANVVLRTGSLMVLARLLSPKDFGLVAMVTVVTGVFGLFKDAGLSVATVQRATITHEQVSTLFWINLAVGTVLGLATAAMAPVLVAFYHEPRLLWVSVIVATGFLFTGAGVQHSVLLQRQMRFVALSAIETLSLVAAIAAAIGLAAAGFGYWALVAMAVTPSAVATAGCWWMTGWLPGPPRRRAGIRSMLRFGGAVSLNGLIVYVAYNVDKLLIGRLWGAEVLGVYGRAYQLINMPTENLNTAIGGVAMSALSRVQEDANRLKNYFLKGYSLVLVLTVPLAFACALFAEDIIHVLLGPKWTATATLFRFLAPTILAYALINPLAWLLFATGQVRRSVHMAVVIGLFVITSFVVAVPFGPGTVALAYSGMMVLLTIPMILWATHGGLVVSWRDVLSAAWPPFGSSLVAAGLSFGVVQLFGQQLTPFPRLILACGTLLTVYAATLLFLMGQLSFYLSLVRDLRTPPASVPVRDETLQLG